MEKCCVVEVVTFLIETAPLHSLWAKHLNNQQDGGEDDANITGKKEGGSEAQQEGSAWGHPLPQLLLLGLQDLT